MGHEFMEIARVMATNFVEAMARQGDRMNRMFIPHVRHWWFVPWPGQSELTPRIHYVQATSNVGNGTSTLA